MTERIQRYGTFDSHRTYISSALTHIILKSTLTELNYVPPHLPLLRGQVQNMFNEILFEMGFVEPQAFFHNFPYSQKYDLIRSTPYHWQLCISQFCDITKGLTGSLGL